MTSRAARGFLSITTVASVGSLSRPGQTARKPVMANVGAGKERATLLLKADTSLPSSGQLYSIVVSTRQEDANSRSTRRRVRPVLFSADHDTSVREA